MYWQSWNENYTYTLLMLGIALIVVSLIFTCITKRGVGEHHSFDMKKKICHLGLLQAFSWFFTWLVNDMVYINTWGYYSYDYPCLVISLTINFSLLLVPFYVIWMMLLGGWKKCNTVPGCCGRRIYGAYFARVVFGFCCWSVFVALFLTISYWGSDYLFDFNDRLQNTYWFYYFITGCLILKIFIYSALNVLNLCKHGHQLEHNCFMMKLSALIMMALEFMIMVAIFNLNANVFLNGYQEENRPHWEEAFIVWCVFGLYCAMFLSTRSAAFEELYNASQEGPAMFGMGRVQQPQTTAVVYTQPGVYSQGMQPQQQVVYAQPGQPQQQAVYAQPGQPQQQYYQQPQQQYVTPGQEQVNYAQ